MRFEITRFGDLFCLGGYRYNGPDLVFVSGNETYIDCNFHITISANGHVRIYEKTTGMQDDFYPDCRYDYRGQVAPANRNDYKER